MIRWAQAKPGYWARTLIGSSENAYCQLALKLETQIGCENHSQDDEVSQDANLWLARGAKTQRQEKKNDIGWPCSGMDPYTSSPIHVYQDDNGLTRGMETSPPRPDHTHGQPATLPSPSAAFQTPHSDSSSHPTDGPQLPVTVNTSNVLGQNASSTKAEIPVVLKIVSCPDLPQYLACSTYLIIICQMNISTEK